MNRYQGRFALPLNSMVLTEKHVMHSGKNNSFQPRSIRLEASTVCQLKCPSCPNAAGEIAKRLGRGFLKFGDFKNIIDRNPCVSHIELSNWGEIFLNKELIAMMQYAHQNNVALSAGNGVNLNNVPEEVLEALVRYKFRAITCSIDGASAETYSLYRVNGNFARVLNNIRTINKYKTIYQSPYPALKWQFVAFGHNEHEIRSARRMAVDLNMAFSLKLSWEDLYGHPFSPIKDNGLIRREAGVGAASRQEYREKYGSEYALRSCCCYLWKTPQINYDGRVLGCPVNYWGDYGNAFRE
ncbi:MAG: radical SAM protein, partial [Nitrospirota bacterium]|nr:radical SAM protein [Nitrospirota bacterium]